MALNFANNNSLSAITTKPSGLSGGAMNLISTQTASSSSTISFTSGIDDTYDEYVFKFYNIHPQTDNAEFQFNFRDGGSAYDATKTTTFFYADHREDDAGASLAYDTGRDLAQGTGVAKISRQVRNHNDSGLNGEFNLFSPSSTTFVKHFIAKNNHVLEGDASINVFTAGYANVTAAIDGVQFSFSSGNIDSGVIKLYGVS